MSLLQFTGGLAIAFAMMQWVVLPVLYRRAIANPTPGRWGAFGLFGYLRFAALVAGLTSGTLLVLIKLTTAFAPATLPKATTLISWCQHWRDAFLMFGAGWFLFTTAIISLGLAIYAYKRVKMGGIQRTDAAYEAAVASLKGEMEAGTVEELPPTPQMKELEELMNRIALEAKAISAGEAPGDEQTLRSMQETYEQLAGARMRFDIHRRVRAKLTPDSLKLTPPRGWWERLQYALFSPALANSLGRRSRLVYAVLAAMLVMAMLRLGTRIAEPQLQARLSELDEISVAMRADAQIKQWQASSPTPQNSSASALSAEDEQAIRQVARQITVRSWDPAVWTHAKPPRSGTSEFRASRVRDAIAQRAVKGREALVRANLSTVSLETDPTLRRAHQAVDAAVRSPEAPIDPLEGYVQAELRKSAEHDPAFLKRVRKASTATPVGDAMDTTLRAERLIQELANAPDLGVMQTAAKAHATEYLKQMSLGANNLGTPPPSFVDELLPRSVRERLDPQFAAANHAGADLDQTLKTLGDRDARPTAIEPIIPDGETKVVNRIREQTNASLKRPGLDNRTRDALREMASMRAAAATVYTDPFPGQRYADVHTPHGQLLAETAPDLLGLAHPGNGGGPVSLPKVGSPRVETPRLARASVRSRSFVRLSGFSRVGGVLVGQSLPSDEEPVADVVAFEWRRVDALHLELTFTLRDGSKRTTQPVRTQLVRRAIEYAVDGRPLAVTMISAAPMQELKILVHPVLVDTTIGAQFVAIDRFVDEITGELTARGDANKRFMGLNALYRRADEIRKRTLLPLFDEKPGNVLPDLPPATPDVLAGLAARDDLIGPDASEKSVLVAKTDFYDAELVRLIASSPKNESDDPVTAFDRHVQEGVKRRLDVVLKMNRETAQRILKRWFQRPPEFEVWSGVRERMPERKLDALLPGSPPSGLIRYMLQVAFTTPPVFRPEWSEDDGSAVEDELPWEFPLIAKELEKTVRSGIDSNPERRTIEADVAEFLSLQRLFRAALSDRLGRDFPVERIDTLHAEVVDAPSDSYPTARWNARPGAMAAFIEELATIMTEKPTDFTGQQTDALKRLAAAAKIVRSRLKVIDSRQPGRAATNAADFQTAFEAYRDANTVLTKECERAEALFPRTESADDLMIQIRQAFDVIAIRALLNVERDDELLLKNMNGLQPAAVIAGGATP